jgi:hypothetical protein
MKSSHHKPVLHPPSVGTSVDMEAVVPNPERPLSPEERRRIREKALTELADIRAFRDIEDPVEWQREIRKDRPLPGRGG